LTRRGPQNHLYVKPGRTSRGQTQKQSPSTKHKKAKKMAFQTGERGKTKRRREKLEGANPLKSRGIQKEDKSAF